jgi:transposase
MQVIIPDILWKEIKKVIPTKTSTVGRPEKDAKIVLSAIFFVLKTGIQWRCLSKDYGKPTTIHGRFRKWIAQGIFSKILEVSIAASIKIFGEPKSFIIDTTSKKSPFAKFGGKNPVDRARNGVKQGVLIDYNQIVFSTIIEAAHVHDSKLLYPHLKNIQKYLKKPVVMIADSAWDSKKLYTDLAKHNIALLAAKNPRRDKNAKKYCPKGRWKVEQFFGRMQWNRGIKFCWCKLKSSFLALCQFAAAVHNFQVVGIFG